MGEQIDVIEAEEFKTPEVKTGLQAFSLIVTGFSFNPYTASIHRATSTTTTVRY